jgi:transposase-like protein
MKISLLVPEVNFRPTARPRACPYCKNSILHRHGTVRKPIKDHGVKEVQAHRYKCLSCERTFRRYPNGVTGKDQSQRTVVLAALMYGLGLSCSAASHLLGALGTEVSKGTVWRDAQEAGEALRKSCPTGTGGRVVRVLGADETVFKVKGREVVVGFVVDVASGRTLGFEVLVEGDGEAFREWLKPYAEELGAEVLVTDDNDSYSVAAAGLGLSHQLCIAHVRKYVKRRSKSILEQAEREWGKEAPEKLNKLEADLGRVRELVEELPGEEGGTQMGRLHRGYSGASPPERKGEKASAAYRTRMLTLELWNKWPKLLLHLRRPELDMDGTNNASERAIGRSKVRYKTMRGYKSPCGMKNGIGLTQWLYSGEDEHDLAEEMAA